MLEIPGKARKMAHKLERRKNLYDIYYDVAIIGGGASGMAAAIATAEANPALKVCIIEKKEELGKKLLATGNGRCNITNTGCATYPEVKNFLASCNLLLAEEEEGRVYPKSRQAASVVEMLKSKCKALNVAIYVSCSVEKVEKSRDRFILDVNCLGELASIPCGKLLIATGGKAGPQFGTTGDGFTLAKAFGHTVKKLSPVLVPVDCADYSGELKGVRARAVVRLMKDEVEIACEEGEIQFTQSGLSGICIFNLSRHLKIDTASGHTKEEEFGRYEIEADFVPELEEDQLLEKMAARRGDMSSLPSEVFLHSAVNTQMGELIMKEALQGQRMSIGNMNDQALEEIVMLLKSYRFQVSGAKGWKDAQCTSGGVELSELDLNTMESKLVPGLYFAGEVTDYDGPCGGFNLNNAWYTGIKAGRAMSGGSSL